MNLLAITLAACTCLAVIFFGNNSVLLEPAIVCVISLGVAGIIWSQRKYLSLPSAPGSGHGMFSLALKPVRVSRRKHDVYRRSSKRTMH